MEMSRGCWRAAGGRGFCAGWGRGVSFQILRGCRFVLCVVLFRWRKAGEKLEKARVKLEKAFFVFVSLFFSFSPIRLCLKGFLLTSKSTGEKFGKVPRPGSLGDHFWQGSVDMLP